MQQPTAPDQAQLRVRRWITRFWLASAIFALLTLADIALAYRFRQAIPVEQARILVYSIVGLFICYELCAIAALLMWISTRIRRQ